MAKILTDKEMVFIISNACDKIDDKDQYMNFLEDLGTIIADHFGGNKGTVDYNPDDGLSCTCAFHINENVPDDGGVFKQFDRDVIWKDGKELERVGNADKKMVTWYRRPRDKVEELERVELKKVLGEIGSGSTECLIITEEGKEYDIYINDEELLCTL